MILETIPELQRLTPQQKLILASELIGDFSDQATPELDAAIGELIQSRLKHFEDHPESARSWHDLQKVIGKA
jgi:hypothetical protein